MGHETAVRMDNPRDYYLGNRRKDALLLEALGQGRLEVDLETGEVYGHRALPGGRVSRKRKAVACLNEHGYRVGSLVAGGGLVRFYCHRVVWLAAHGPIPEGYQIDHINRVRDDNRLINLRVVTPAEQKRNRGAMAGGKRPRLAGTVVREILRLHRDEGLSVPRIAERFGLGPSTVRGVVAGRTYRNHAAEAPDGARRPIAVTVVTVAEASR